MINGNLMKSAGAPRGGIFSTESFLSHLLANGDCDLLGEMMEAVANGLEWRRMVQVFGPTAKHDVIAPEEIIALADESDNDVIKRRQLAVEIAHGITSFLPQYASSSKSPKGSPSARLSGQFCRRFCSFDEGSAHLRMQMDVSHRASLADLIEISGEC